MSNETGNKASTKFLGIETSCDETAASVVEWALDANGQSTGNILSNAIHSQIEDHAEFGGVVPEIAARAHAEKIDTIIKAALQEADVSLSEIDAIAATAGPGLMGGLMVGLTTAKAMASTLQKPFYAINHLEGHALTARLTDNLTFPYLLLLVSGGHTQIIWVEGVGQYRRLGTTIDDALGEAFDKTAKMLGLDYPGGPAVERMALNGNADAIPLPKPMAGKPGCDFSFSGLKTAVRQAAMKAAPLSDKSIADICASFQKVVAQILVDRMENAFKEVGGAPPLVIAGGVAANQTIRSALSDLVAQQRTSLIAPPLNLCTDNAAMIAWAAAERKALSMPVQDMSFAPRSRWPLDETAQTKMGHGKRGAKV